MHSRADIEKSYRNELVPMGAPWSVVSSLPQPLMALPAFADEALSLHWIRRVCEAGEWLPPRMVVAELLPEARENASLPRVAGALGAAFTAMVVLQVLLPH